MTKDLCCTISCDYFNSDTLPYRADIINAVFYRAQLSELSAARLTVLYHYDI